MQVVGEIGVFEFQVKPISLHMSETVWDMPAGTPSNRVYRVSHNGTVVAFRSSSGTEIPVF